MSSPAPATSGPAPRRPGATAATGLRVARIGLSAVLGVLACLLVPLTLIAVWVNDIALDTDRYVATVAPLATNRAVQDAAAARITSAVDVRVDGPGAAAQLADWLRSQGLPPQAAQAVRGLGPQLDAAVHDTVHKAALKVVRGERFRRVWTRANRRAHAAVVHALTGEGRGAVGVSDGTVTVDIGTAVDELKRELKDAGVAPAAAVPTPDRQFVVLSSEQLGKVRTAAHWLDVVGDWMPALTAVVAAACVLLARRRRRALARTALGAAAACLAVAIALAVVRSYYLDHLPPAVRSRDAAAAVFDILLRFLRAALRTAVVLGVVIALGAWLSGPGRLPAAVRRRCDATADAVVSRARAHGVHTGRAGAWTRDHRTAVTAAAAVAVGAGFAAWNRPTPAVILLLALVLLFLLALIALLAADGRSAVRLPSAAAGPAGPGERGAV